WRDDRQTISPALIIAKLDGGNRIRRLTSSHFQHCHALALLVYVQVLFYLPLPPGEALTGSEGDLSSKPEWRYCQAPCPASTIPLPARAARPEHRLASPATSCPLLQLYSPGMLA